MQQQRQVPLDFNNLGGATKTPLQNSNYNNPYNNNPAPYMNNSNFSTVKSLQGYPMGSYNDSNIQNGSNSALNLDKINVDIKQSNYQANYSNPNHIDNPTHPRSINKGLNEFVRQNLESRGISFARSPSPHSIQINNQEKKKILLDNIQSQMNLNKRTKLEELKRKQEEDAQYLKDMITCFPFGRGGGGAPIRDKNGNIITNRRALVSDPRYNLVSINVDDDYYDVWDKNKRIGKYSRNDINAMNEYNNNVTNNGNYNLNQDLQNYENNLGNINNGMNPAFNNMTTASTLRPYSTMPRNVYTMTNIPVVDQFPNPHDQINTNFYNVNDDYNIRYNNNPVTMPQPIDQPLPVYSTRMQVPANAEQVSVSYNNYNQEDEVAKQKKYSYRNDLLDQIKENENRKLLAKKQKELEDAKEEERLRREQEELELREKQEKMRTQNLAEKVRNENNDLIQFKNIKNSRTVVVNNGANNNNPPGYPAPDFEDLQKKEIESRLKLNNEILKLREQMQDQQNNLYNQIQTLKQETQNANDQRYAALKEIESLKEELSKQRADEELRRKYVYDVIVDENNSNAILNQETHLPEPKVEKVNLPVVSEKDLYYEEKIRHPNKIIPIPKLTELHENGLKTNSQFIDMDTRNVYDGLELYEPNDKANGNPNLLSSEDNDAHKLGHFGIDVQGEYGTLRTYDNLCSNSINTNGRSKVNISLNDKNIQSFENIKDVKTSVKKQLDDIGEDIHINIQTDGLDNDRMDINDIYNRNIERLRSLNEMESRFYDGKTLGSYPKNKEITSEFSLENLKNNMRDKENFDGFINKINETCKQPEEVYEITVEKVNKES